MTDFSRALHELQTAPGITASEAEALKQGILALGGAGGPDVTVAYDPEALDVIPLNVEHGETADGLKTTYVELLEVPREEPTS